MDITRQGTKDSRIKNRRIMIKALRTCSEHRTHRTEKQQTYIVKSKRSLLKKMVEAITTCFMWAYMVMVICFFGTALLKINNEKMRILKAAFKVSNTSVSLFVVNVGILIFIIALILGGWRIYNKRRFGKLNRRKHPVPTTDEDMLQLMLIEPEEFKKLKRDKVCVFEHNPILSLKVEIAEKGERKICIRDSREQWLDYL